MEGLFYPGFAYSLPIPPILMVVVMVVVMVVIQVMVQGSVRDQVTRAMEKEVEAIHFFPITS
jgi:uncharacterized membrane protein